MSIIIIIIIIITIIIIVIIIIIMIIIIIITIIIIINPWRVCAARVTVLCLSFCLFVCLSVRHAILAVRATKSITKDTIVLSVRFAAILK